MTICRMRIPKATNTHIVYIIFIAFYIATMVARTRPNITLYVRCLSLFSTSVHAERVASVWPVDSHTKHVRTRHCAPNNFVVYGTECPQHRRNNCDV
jgi:hypothetical protein